MKILNYLIIVVLISTLSCTNKKREDCNLLETYSEQHNYLEFIECKDGEGQVIKYSNYNLTGEHSFEVEKYLVDNYGMGKLKFTCCGWEPKDGKEGEIVNSDLKNLNKNYHLLVSMTGSAEKKNENDSLYIEMDRNKIDKFVVTVKLVEI